MSWEKNYNVLHVKWYPVSRSWSFPTCAHAWRMKEIPFRSERKQIAEAKWVWNKLRLFFFRNALFGELLVHFTYLRIRVSLSNSVVFKQIYFFGRSRHGFVVSKPERPGSVWVRFLLMFASCRFRFRFTFHWFRAARHHLWETKFLTRLALMNIPLRKKKSGIDQGCTATSWG